MRILLLSAMVPRREGSGAIPVLLYAELAGLAERHEVTLLSTIGDEPGEMAAALELREALPQVDLRLVDRRAAAAPARRWGRRARLAARWLRGGWPWRTVWFADAGARAELERVTAGPRFDVVSVEDSAMSVFDLPRGVPSVFTANEVLRPRPVDWRAGSPVRWPRWALRELDWRRWGSFQPSAWRRFDLVQVFAQRDAQAIGEMAPDVVPRVRVNPFGVVLPAPADPAREEPGLMLFVGHFAHPPNRDAALWLAGEIMPAVRKLRPDARLRIVGTAPTPEVRGLASSSVEVIGDAPSVEPHLAAAAVVLAPVRTGGGMRMKVLQAMAAGKAVLTTPRGTEGIEQAGEELPLAVAEDAEGIAATASELLADPGRRRRLGAQARRFAELHHSPEAWAQRLERIYGEAGEISRSGPHG